MGSHTIEEVKSITGAVPEEKKTDIKRILMTLFKAVISVSLIYYILSKTDLGEIWASMKSANVTLIIFSFMLHAVGYFASAYRWRILALAQGMDLSVSYLVQSYAVAMFFNNVLPSTIGGDAIRAYDSWRKGYPKLKSIATVGVERFIGLFALVIFALLALALSTEMNNRIPYLWVWTIGIFVIMLVVVQGIFLQEGKARKLGKLFELPGLRIVKKQVQKFSDAFADFRGKKKALIYALGLSLILQINVIFHYYLISEALDLSIPFVKFCVIIPIALFVQMIPISINAIGIRENLYVFFLTLYGASIASCIAFSWIAYGMILFLGIFGGVLYVFRR